MILCKTVAYVALVLSTCPGGYDRCRLSADRAHLLCDPDGELMSPGSRICPKYTEQVYRCDRPGQRGYQFSEAPAP
jgi:hypothetical protein